MTACCCAWASCASACSHRATACATRLWRSSTATRCASMGVWATLRSARMASICCRIGAGACACCAATRVASQVVCSALRRRATACRRVASPVSTCSQPVVCWWRCCQRCCCLWSTARVGCPCSRVLVAASSRSMVALTSGSTRVDRGDGGAGGDLRRSACAGVSRPPWPAWLLPLPGSRPLAQTQGWCATLSAAAPPPCRRRRRGAAGARACSYRPLSRSYAS